MDTIFVEGASLQLVLRLTLAVLIGYWTWKGANRIVKDQPVRFGKGTLPASIGFVFTILAFTMLSFLATKAGIFADLGQKEIQSLSTHEVISSVFNFPEVFSSLASLCLTIVFYKLFFEKISDWWGIIIGFVILVLMPSIVWGILSLGLKYSADAALNLSNSSSWETTWNWLNSIGSQ